MFKKYRKVDLKDMINSLLRVTETETCLTV